MSGVPVYRTAIANEWIDYNGHLRDAYYSLIVSLATDAMMDRVGLDEAYRKATGNTLYTLEMHLHFLREVKKTDTIDVRMRVLGTDRKRIHAALDLYCERFPEPAATAELMLLHVHQGETVTSAAFPPSIAASLAALAAQSTATPESAQVPGSRRIELRSR